MTGGAGNYTSSNLTLSPGTGAGGVNVNTIGEAGARYVMLELGAAGNIAAVLAELDALPGVVVIDNAAEDAEFATCTAHTIRRSPTARSILCCA